MAAGTYLSATLLDLIAALIRLLQTRKLNRRDYFEKIIDPLYKDFVPVALDMLQMFRTARFHPAAFGVELVWARICWSATDPKI